MMVFDMVVDAVKAITLPSIVTMFATVAGSPEVEIAIPYCEITVPTNIPPPDGLITAPGKFSTTQKTWLAKAPLFRITLTGVAAYGET
jgi:hypothetical protein